jgi:osmotically-inducible protein OsmY
MRGFYSWMLLVVVMQTLSGCATLDDRRSTEDSFVDQNIQKQAISQINSHYRHNVHVNVTSFNKHVLLTGEVPDDATKSGVAQLVSGVQNVGTVNNELVVGPVEGLGSRSADSLITSEVKIRIVRHGTLQTGHMKIVTENGSVYLMGLAYRKEAALAADLASTTKGVKRVVMLFDYLD